MTRTESDTQHRSLPIGIARRAPSVARRTERAQSCPEIDSVLLFECSASRSNERSFGEESTDASNDNSRDSKKHASSHSRRCQQSEDFRELFAFLDDAHKLGYAVEHTQSATFMHNGAICRRRKPERAVQLRAPSFERCSSNSPLLEQRASLYASRNVTRAKTDTKR